MLTASRLANKAAPHEKKLHLQLRKYVMSVKTKPKADKKSFPTFLFCFQIQKRFFFFTYVS